MSAATPASAGGTAPASLPFPPEEVLRQAIDLVQNEMLPAIEASGNAFFDALLGSSSSSSSLQKSEGMDTALGSSVGSHGATGNTGNGSEVKGVCDPVQAEAQARQLRTLLTSLLAFLLEHGLSGLPLLPQHEEKSAQPEIGGQKTLAEATLELSASAHEQFEKKDRIRDAAGIVRGILNAKVAAAVATTPAWITTATGAVRAAPSLS